MIKIKTIFFAVFVCTFVDSTTAGQSEKIQKILSESQLLASHPFLNIKKSFLNSDSASESDDDLALPSILQGLEVTYDPDDSNIFDGRSVNELERVLENSPEEIKEQVDAIIAHVTSPSGRLSCNHYHFIGDPGTGKTTAALAIAEKACRTGQWKAIFVPSTYFLGHYLHETTTKLRTVLDAIRNYTTHQKTTHEKGRSYKIKKLFLIIDEVNRILNNTKSDHGDTSESASEFWTFLDRQIKNSCFYFIGTMNDPDKLFFPYQSRIIGTSAIFKASLSTNQKLKIFRDNLKDRSLVINNVSDHDLIHYMETLNYTPRDLIAIAISLQVSALSKNPRATSFAITKNHIDNAFKKHQILRDAFKYGEPQETDEERRHKESMDLNKASMDLHIKQHAESMEFQKDTHKFQLALAHTQMKAQILLHENTKVQNEGKNVNGGLPFVGGGYNTAESVQVVSKDGKDSINKLFSEVST